MRAISLLMLFFLPYFVTVSASDCDECASIVFPLPNRLTLGPEISHIKRTREGGGKQTGTLYGVRFNYDRIKRYKLYFGFEALYDSGTLRGKSGTGQKLKSKFSDEEVEVRAGYTFQAKNCWQPAFTPFVGYGYFWETNKYRHPSPVHLKFQNKYRYVAYGFLSSFVLADVWTLGLNFKAKYLIHPRCRVSDDPDYPSHSMIFGEKLNYRIELPVSYSFCYCDCSFEAGLMPFYELRHYGGRESYPFDFLDTKLRLIGATFLLIYRF